MFEEGEEFDVRPFHIMFQHKIHLVRVFEYANLDNFLLNYFVQNMESSNIALTCLLKYKMLGDIKNLDKASDYFKKIEDYEYKYIAQAVNNMSELNR